uniref:Secreted protein n=1 Tax=Lotharella oceanica TaxID=641309 RepID=A0A7S2TPL5_9EUKA
MAKTCCVWLLTVGGTLAWGVDAETQLNVQGQALEKCDRSHVDDPRYPTTGYMRPVEELANRCTAVSHDAGSHYVCVNLPSASATNGETYSPFWTKTGQARSALEATTWPKPGPWCICMWAFARMHTQHPEFINDLDCKATNGWTLDRYDTSVASQRNALRAICDKCGVTSGKCASF